jgi:hypothetical protein
MTGWMLLTTFVPDFEVNKQKGRSRLGSRDAMLLDGISVW